VGKQRNDFQTELNSFRFEKPFLFSNSDKNIISIQDSMRWGGIVGRGCLALTHPHAPMNKIFAKNEIIWQKRELFEILGPTLKMFTNLLYNF
jgi:hypothetical protein